MRKIQIALCKKLTVDAFFLLFNTQKVFFCYVVSVFLSEPEKHARTEQMYLIFFNPPFFYVTLNVCNKVSFVCVLLSR